MSKFNVNVEHVPSYQEYTITSSQLRELLNRTYPGIQIHLWDRAYGYISHADWGKVFKRMSSTTSLNILQNVLTARITQCCVVLG